MPPSVHPAGAPLSARSWVAVRAAMDRRRRAAELTARKLALELYVAAAQQELEDAHAAYDNEQRDVNDLEDRWLPLIGAAAKDRHEVAVVTERSERDAAAAALAAARANLAAREGELSLVSATLESLGDVESPFDHAVRSYAAHAGGQHARALRDANGTIAQSHRELARLDETLLVGQAALDTLDEADTQLQACRVVG